MSSYLISALATGVSSQFTQGVDNIGSALNSTANGTATLAASALSRGANAAQAGQYDTAVTEFRRAAAYDPTDPNAYMYMAQVYMMMKKPDSAVDAYKKALLIDPVNADAKNGLAGVYVSQKNYGAAEKLEKQIAAADPTNPTPPTTLGFIYMTTGRYAEAETQFTTVTRLAPDSATAYYNLGLLKNKQGDYASAVKLFQQSLSLDPNSENTHADLAYAYMGLKQPDDAQNQYNQLAQMGTTAAMNLLPQVSQAINTPKFLYEDSSQSNFSSLVGPGTPVSALDSSLSTPGATKIFKVTFKFNEPMDISSVLQSTNWSITKGTGGQAGAYNYGADLHPSQDVNISPLPLSVTYDSSAQTATVYFRITQNAAGNGLIDPSHWVFQFSGKDVYGRKMDPIGDQYDGHRISPF